MKRFVKTTPEGVKDLLFAECAGRRFVERKINEVFELRGYHEIITPTLEYYDIFSFDTSYMPMDEMYKMTDLTGRLLVLRPDITVAIARVVATHLKDAIPPIRLSYNQNVFRITPNLSGRRDEIAQCGVELIGASGVKSDLEIITTAVAAIQAVCGNEFRFEIGHIDFFKSLIDQLPLDPAQRDEIHELIRIKNFALLNDRLSRFKHLPAAQGLMRLPSLFGGAEVLKEAREFSAGEKMLNTLNYLEYIYSYMLELGLGGHVIIDLGVVPGNSYYSGIVFRGYELGLGAAILSGGRYDRLLREFGRDLPATGFAIYIDELVKSATRRKAEYSRQEYIIHSEKGYEIKAFNYADSLRKQNIVCSVSAFDEQERSTEYAKVCDVGLILVGEEIKHIEI